MSENPSGTLSADEASAYTNRPSPTVACRIVFDSLLPMSCVPPVRKHSCVSARPYELTCDPFPGVTFQLRSQKLVFSSRRLPTVVLKTFYFVLYILSLQLSAMIGLRWLRPRRSTGLPVPAAQTKRKVIDEPGVFKISPRKCSQDLTWRTIAYGAGYLYETYKTP